MKEFALKHPILTFLLADTLIAGVVNIVRTGLVAFGKNEPRVAAFRITKNANSNNEEETTDESANDVEQGM